MFRQRTILLQRIGTVSIWNKRDWGIRAVFILKLVKEFVKRSVSSLVAALWFWLFCVQLLLYMSHNGCSFSCLEITAKLSVTSPIRISLLSVCHTANSRRRRTVAVVTLLAVKLLVSRKVREAIVTSSKFYGLPWDWTCPVGRWKPHLLAWGVAVALILQGIKINHTSKCCTWFCRV